MASEDGPGHYDVVIVGGGPVGLLMAYQMQRFGVTACVLEQHDKSTQDAYGRAIALFPRTTEQLDQLEVVDPMLQLGFACRSSVTYKDGERVLPGRVWTFMEQMGDTSFDFTLVLRQMYTEAVLREKLAAVGGACFMSTQCTDFQVDTAVPHGGYAVTSTFLDKATGRTFSLKSKYLVGADGGRSFVRRRADIPFDGDSTEDQWIRIDGIVETDMPITRSYGLLTDSAIESRTHGNVLWAPLDHGATRIGYAYSAAIAAKYPGGVTQEVAVREAEESMRPFRVRFREVHWWTLYTIGQRMARDFAAHDHRVLLCGDAAHTHSSGAAQGLNTGIHDAVNLGWKLALAVRGVVDPAAVLPTYAAERRTAVQQLLDYDRDIATLMSHKWPAGYDGDRSGDPYVALGALFERAAPFNTGLGISYPANLLNQEAEGVGGKKVGVTVNGTKVNGHTNRHTETKSVTPGSRPPDVDLTAPGTLATVRLQRATRNRAQFVVLVLAGAPDATRPQLQALAKQLAEEGPTPTPLTAHPAVRFLTIPAAAGCSPYETLGTQPLGETYYDGSGAAHRQLGVDPQAGGIVVLRPDGLVGTAGPLHASCVQAYFGRVFV